MHENFEAFASALCQELDLDVEGLTKSTRLSEDLGIDSLGMAELLMILADDGVVLPQELISELATVGDVYHYYDTIGSRIPV